MGLQRAAAARARATTARLLRRIPARLKPGSCSEGSLLVRAVPSCEQPVAIVLGCSCERGRHCARTASFGEWPSEPCKMAVACQKGPQIPFKRAVSTMQRVCPSIQHVQHAATTLLGGCNAKPAATPALAGSSSGHGSQPADARHLIEAHSTVPTSLQATTNSLSGVLSSRPSFMAQPQWRRARFSTPRASSRVRPPQPHSIHAASQPPQLRPASACRPHPGRSSARFPARRPRAQPHSTLLQTPRRVRLPPSSPAHSHSRRSGRQDLPRACPQPCQCRATRRATFAVACRASHAAVGANLGHCALALAVGFQLIGPAPKAVDHTWQRLMYSKPASLSTGVSSWQLCGGALPGDA
jgi:hypothetical protein